MDSSEQARHGVHRVLRFVTQLNTFWIGLSIRRSIIHSMQSRGGAEALVYTRPR